VKLKRNTQKFLVVGVAFLIRRRGTLIHYWKLSCVDKKHVEQRLENRVSSCIWKHLCY
jgi:hypothetical protein